MKSILTVVAILAVLAVANTQEESKNVPAFVKSLRNLHQGPPKVKMTKRANVVSNVETNTETNVETNTETNVETNTETNVETKTENNTKTNVETKWITQRLDHFNESNQNTWEMRYMVNDQYFEEGGPMFIYLGGEGAISPGVIVSGIWPDLAAKHKGILFCTEHRYYGKSRPTEDLSGENIQYLNVRQALEDLAHFIRTQRESDSRLKNSKVIICGCSYSAAMVVWLRKLHPELVNGGWASSAPILAKVDFKEYKEIVGKALLELGSQQCYNRVQNGIRELEAMFLDNRAAEAKDMLELCDSFDHENDLNLGTLFATIANLFANVVKFQSGNDVHNFCNFITSTRFINDVEPIATYFWAKSLGDDDECVDATYNSTLSYYLNSTYANGYSRAWFYQTCNEFGWYKSSASKKQPFGTKVHLKLYITLCRDVFGKKYTNEHIHNLVAETNNVFGGLNPQVENVYMTHGALDPWSAVGHGVSEGATVIPRASHCADFDSISDDDSPEMRASKERLTELVSQWVA